MLNNIQQNYHKLKKVTFEWNKNRDNEIQI